MEDPEVQDLKEQQAEASPISRIEERALLGAEPIHVDLREGKPTRLLWRGRPFKVTAIEATWCADGRWWMDASRRGIHRRYYRLSLLAANRTPLCVEVYHWRCTWTMWRVLD